MAHHVLGPTRLGAWVLISEDWYNSLSIVTNAGVARLAGRLESTAEHFDAVAKAAHTLEGDRVVAQMRGAPIDDPLFGRIRLSAP